MITGLSVELDSDVICCDGFVLIDAVHQSYFDTLKDELRLLVINFKLYLPMISVAMIRQMI